MQNMKTHRLFGFLFLNESYLGLNCVKVEKSAGWMGGAKTNFGRKRFHTTPNDVTIEDNLIENEESEQDLAMLTQVSSDLCEAGKTSGWLQCTDPTGVGP